MSQCVCWIRGQLPGVCSLFPIIVWDQTQVIKLGGRHLYPLSRLGSFITPYELYVCSLGTVPYLQTDKIMHKG